jgi:N-acetylmuramoyl-L-alanine amidase
VLLLLPALAAAQSTPLRVVRTVVLDPGHGGGNEGAMGAAGSQEKDQTLAVAYAIRDRLQRDYPELRVIVTRNLDIDLTLSERLHLAHNEGADLFLSLHMNSARNKEAHGFEVFYLRADKSMPLVTSGEGGWGHDFKAPADPSEAVPTAAPEGLPTLLADLEMGRAHKDSSKLAEFVLSELKRACPGRASRGVRQANFGVLRGARVPAVVVEFGFLSNKREERWLTSPAARDAFAQATSRTVARMDQFLYRRDVLASPPPESTGRGSLAKND